MKVFNLLTKLLFGASVICNLNFSQTASAETIPHFPPGDFFSENLIKIIIPHSTEVTIYKIISKATITNENVHRFVSFDTRSRYAFVDGVFQSLIGRHASVAEQFYFVKMLTGSSKILVPKLVKGRIKQVRVRIPKQTREQVIQRIASYSERLKLITATYYKVFLNRTPTIVEAESFIKLLESGTDERSLALAFLSSEEYLSKFTDSFSTVAQFYYSIRGYLPNTESELQWVTNIISEPTAQIADLILHNTETTTELILAAFSNILKRPPTSAELLHWHTSLQNRTITPAQMIRTLLASDEYYALALRISIFA